MSSFISIFNPENAFFSVNAWSIEDFSVPSCAFLNNIHTNNNKNNKWQHYKRFETGVLC